MHPTDEQLIAHLLGVAADTGAVARHLAGPCTECAARVREVEFLLATLRADRDPNAPPEWIAAALRAYRPAAVGESVAQRIRDWAEGLVEAAGRLVADSAAPGLAFGMRTAAASRRLRFESEDVELDVEVEPEAGGVRITGQFAVLRPEPRPLAAGRMLLVTSSGLWQDGATDALGEFDARVDDARDLQLRVVHEGKVILFEVPEPRTSE